MNILYNILSNGKFDLENIDYNYDITKNQNILTLMINILKIEKDDNNQKQPLLNLIIRIIGLFIKQFFFFPKEIDISIFSEFLRFVPNVLNNKEGSSYLYVNLIKVLGLMITFANIHIQKSLSFYKSFIDFNLLFSLLKVLKIMEIKIIL